MTAAACDVAVLVCDLSKGDAIDCKQSVWLTATTGLQYPL